MDRPVNILLQYWALDAFRADAHRREPRPRLGLHRRRRQPPGERDAAIPWLETFRMAKELGEVSVLACSGSLDVLGIDVTTLDPLVDASGGIATFLLAAEDGQIVFI